ncbi:salicylate hydroxylase [Podospora appendiculata]|uniref:Salicylate hydroxylase n=1 Tax=Podospora appendiculata TaxID=314037 RepID=A0AAE0X078_9PEZI|nr:salicylate hydroxylase [Podospora appendiculata]
MSTFQPRIAVAGGGPSGLALGLLLNQRGIRTTIYELRSKPTPEELAKPSGMLDLHEESGQKVMRECGLWDAFQAALGDCAESMRILNSDGVVLHEHDGRLASRPEVPRNALANIFIENMPADIIKWDYKIFGAKRTRDEATGAVEITLDLGPNGTATYDLVVGADGAWSRIRKLLSDVKPFYSGALLVAATMRHASTKYPHFVELNGPGTLMALGHRNGILTHRGPQDSIRVWAAISTPDENWASTTGLEGKTPAEIKAPLLEDPKLFRDWAPLLKELFSTACDEETKDNPGSAANILPLYMLPIGYRWEHHTGVTLLGDAAHLMTPWAGEGVNLALWDSLDLAYAIAAVPETADAAAWQAALEPLVKGFEDVMLTRATEKAEETARNKDICLGEDGAKGLVAAFQMYTGMALAAQAEAAGTPESAS